MMAPRKVAPSPPAAPLPPADSCPDDCEFCRQDRQAKLRAAARARPRPTEAVKRAVVQKIREKLQQE